MGAVPEALAHHPSTVLGIHLTGLLTLGDVIVGAGTLLLAYFTWRLATATYALDAKNAARERKRREREVRGVARLLDGDLEIIGRSLQAGFEKGGWIIGHPLPTRTWERDGALIAETIPEDEALRLIRIFDSVDRLLRTDSMVRERSPKAPVVPGPAGTPFGTTLALLRAEIKDARRDLRRFAYPDARELEPDPTCPPRRPDSNAGALAAAELRGSGRGERRDHALRLLWDDGTVGDVSFKDDPWDGVFAPLRDPARFAKVSINMGTLCWPEEGLDWAPEPLYEATRANRLAPASAAAS